MCTVEWDESAANKLCAIESIKVSANCKRRFITTTNCKTQENKQQIKLCSAIVLLTHIHTHMLYVCTCVRVCVCVFAFSYASLTVL